jgi:hypothetical protein
MFSMRNRTSSFVFIALASIAAISGGCGKSETTAETSKQVVASVPTSKWEGKLVRRPGTTAEDGKVYVVQGGRKRWVVSGAWLKENGYKFPGDVSVISAEELASIPDGDVIQSKGSEER